MKNVVIGFLISAFLVTGCAIGFGRHGEVVVVPALPVTVEVDADQYYYQNGYYYHYNGSVWYYSERREGPWRDLPRSHYPKEVRYRGQNNRDHDNRDQDNRDHDNRQHN
jgi:hypothetical protein